MSRICRKRSSIKLCGDIFCDDRTFDHGSLKVLISDTILQLDFYRIYMYSFFKSGLQSRHNLNNQSRRDPGDIVGRAVANFDNSLHVVPAAGLISILALVGIFSVYVYYQ